MNSRQAVAGSVGPETAAPCTSSIGISPLRIAHPDRGLERGRVAAEPCVGVVVGRPRLAGVGASRDVRADARPVEHVLLEHVRDRRRDPVRDDPRPLRLSPAAADLAAGEDDPPDRDRLGVHAAGRQRRVDGGHVERGHRAGAESERRRRLQLRLHAELLRHCRDCRPRRRRARAGRRPCCPSGASPPRRSRARRRCRRTCGRATGAGRSRTARRGSASPTGSSLPPPPPRGRSA